MFGSTEFDGREPDDGVDNRFSPLVIAGQVVPVMYGGVDDHTAAAETIFHTLPAGRRPGQVYLSAYLSWQWSQIHARRDLVLLPLDSRTGPLVTTLVDGDRSSYSAARAAVSRLLQDHPDVDGLVWASRQLHDQPSQVDLDIEATAVSLLLVAPSPGREGGITRDDLTSDRPGVPFATPGGVQRLFVIASDLDVTVVTP